MSIDVNISALNAIATRVAVRANNIANVSTDGFKSSSAILQTGGNGQGVRVGSIERSSTPGSLVGKDTLQTGADGVVRQISGLVETGNTDLLTDIIGLNTDKLAFSANVKAIKAQDEMTGTVLNLKT